MAEVYFGSRDLKLPSGDDLNDRLRFHPRPHHPTGVWLPGIVCLVRDPLTNAALGIHRTYLTDHGEKTALAQNRLLLGGRLGVIKPVEDVEITTRLELAEGLESGLALLTAAQRHGFLPPPIWAAVSASALAKFPLLAGIEVLTLHPDNDEPGRRPRRKLLIAGPMLPSRCSSRPTRVAKTGTTNDERPSQPRDGRGDRCEAACRRTQDTAAFRR